MLPPSLRTGARSTHHHRVTTAEAFSEVDIAKPFNLVCCRCTSEHTSPQVTSMCAAMFENLFENSNSAAWQAHATGTKGATHGPPRRQIRHHHRRGQRH